IVQETEIVQEAEVVQELIAKTDLEIEASRRRQKIIDSMLAETKKREDKEGFKVRELGETEGRAYSAVVFGNESTKNIKKWKRWERRRLKEEKKKRRKK
ncbi:MAG: hypothetical protein KAU62_12500, partial [Candidatus Heimdallarchaeota archaeon]|nr:hypothetical protein [Candidatus Heimdallarchaeota archaeon]MCK4611970.1 hypothetical protein [Candidatus Heimdallarchaeota archaeon]